MSGRLPRVHCELGPVLCNRTAVYKICKLTPPALAARGFRVRCSALLARVLMPHIARAGGRHHAVARLAEFLAGNDQFFLNLAMAAGKATADAAAGVVGSTLVTALARNGTEFGIRVSALGDRWFTAPVETPVGLYFPGFGADDANPDMGDSAIVETSVADINKDPAMPNACAAESVNNLGGSMRSFTVGCLSLMGSTLNYAGPVWHVRFTCTGAGAQTISFDVSPPSPTFVASGAPQPAHFHDGLTITCFDLPPGGDADGDGCTNAQEVGPGESSGGDRDPLNAWDFYDVTGDEFIDFGDTLLILAHFGHGHTDDALDPSLDRAVPDGLKPWRTMPGMDGVDLTDAVNNLKSYGHACV